MAGDEVGRWCCIKCGREIVAAGNASEGRHRISAYVGPCPWDCGAQISRGFRSIRPGGVSVHRAEEWDAAQRSAGA